MENEISGETAFSLFKRYDDFLPAISLPLLTANNPLLFSIGDLVRITSPPGSLASKLLTNCIVQLLRPPPSPTMFSALPILYISCLRPLNTSDIVKSLSIFENVNINETLQNLKHIAVSSLSELNSLLSTLNQNTPTSPNFSTIIVNSPSTFFWIEKANAQIISSQKNTSTSHLKSLNNTSLSSTVFQRLEDQYTKFWKLVAHLSSDMDTLVFVFWWDLFPKHAEINHNLASNDTSIYKNLTYDLTFANECYVHLSTSEELTSFDFAVDKFGDRVGVGTVGFSEGNKLIRLK